jgi:acyl-CoA synthetase (AMP-forming)/AMP-acid ligase II
VEDLVRTHPEWGSIRWKAIESIPLALAGDWKRPPVHADTLAILQYTSGSLAAPKGVMVSHCNVLENEKMLQESHTRQLAGTSPGGSTSTSFRSRDVLCTREHNRGDTWRGALESRCRDSKSANRPRRPPSNIRYRTHPSVPALRWWKAATGIAPVRSPVTYAKFELCMARSY